MTYQLIEREGPAKSGLTDKLGCGDEGPFSGFPVIEALCNHPDLVSEQPFKGLGGAFLLHPRPSMVALINGAIRLGMEPARMTALVKRYEYPERQESVAWMRDAGVRVACVSEGTSAITSFAAQLGKRPFVVADDGGALTIDIYARPDLLKKAIGFVEQTTRGVWQVNDEVGRLSKPHLALPDSRLKPGLECIDVGEAITEALETHLAGHLDLATSNVAVLGVAGVIGTAAARALHARGATVYGYDTKFPAYFELFNQGRINVCRSKAEAIAGRDIIIGATGRTGIELADLPLLKHGAILASASSEQVEFPVSLLHQLSNACTPYCPPGAAAPLGTTLELRPSGRKVTLLDNGRPINLGIAAPPERRRCFDVVMGLMLACMVDLVRGLFGDRKGWITREVDEVAERHRLAELRNYFDREWGE
ncbi:MAG: adenosylhomocysteinase [Sphingomonadales bacterium]|nr:adenosylhomocysteinase [Sphingomonadales bacterium]